MQRSHIMFTIAALFSLSTAAVYAQTAATAPQQSQSAATSADNSQSAVPSFDDLDKQHHGYLLRSDIPKDVEALKPLRVHFRDADTDGNGQLSRSEYNTYIQTYIKNRP